MSIVKIVAVELVNALTVDITDAIKPASTIPLTPDGAKAFIANGKAIS